MTEYLGDVALNFDIRPVTLAYLIRAGSREGFLRAVRLASSRWGGGRELIVPVKGGDLEEPWKDGITRVFRPDALVDLAGLRASASTRIADSVGVQVLKMTKDGLDRFDGLHQLATYDKNAMHRLELVLPKTLTLQSAAAVGHMASGAERKQWEKFGIRFAVTNDPVELVVAQLTHQTVLATTVNHCGQVYMEGLSPHSVVVVVTQPVDNLDDALYFWNIRARHDSLRLLRRQMCFGLQSSDRRSKSESPLSSDLDGMRALPSFWIASLRPNGSSEDWLATWASTLWRAAASGRQQAVTGWNRLHERRR